VGSISSVATAEWFTAAQPISSFDANAAIFDGERFDAGQLHQGDYGWKGESRRAVNRSSSVLLFHAPDGSRGSGDRDVRADRSGSCN
jgi:hypothetical protein